MVYLFQHPKTKKVIEVVQGINEVHEHFDKKGVKWTRLFTVPHAIIDGKLDPFDQNAFLDKTRHSKGQKMGDLWERSGELSEKRAAKRDGVDPLKKKYYDDYAKKRKGKRHMDELKKAGNQTFML